MNSDHQMTSNLNVHEFPSPSSEGDNLESNEPVKKEVKKRKRTVKTEKTAENKTQIADSSKKTKKTKTEKPAKKEKKEKTVKKEKKQTTDKKKSTKKAKKPTTKKKPKKAAPKKKPIRKKLPPKRTIVKSARSVWISFLSKVRAEKRPEHDNLSFGELCKILSPVWKVMTVEDKQPFMDAYTRDKERYRSQLLNLTDEEKKILRAHKRLRRKRKLGKPKSAVSAYMLSVTALRPEVVAANPAISFQEIGRELGRRWREMSDSDREKYAIDAKVDRKRYDDEMAAWKEAEENKRLARKAERELKAEERKTRLADKLILAETLAAKAQLPA
jgi:hypothetical protein